MRRPVISALLKPKPTTFGASNDGYIVKKLASNYPILVITHPGSACGSADFNLGGNGYLSQSCREAMIEQFNSWQGGLIVLSGDFDDELRQPKYRSFGNAIDALLSRTQAAGKVSIRKLAPDPDNAKAITKILSDPTNRASQYICTGAWWYGGDDGCVGATAAAIRALGFSPEISDTVVTEEGVSGNDSWDEDDDANVVYMTSGRA
jgi:hypothetical protein